MDIKLYNTLTRKKEKFKPITKGSVGLYTCGPTVYNYAHIGNLRTYIFEDLLKRMFIYNDYHVKHVMNVTDVGHMTSDQDSGEDKLEVGARREKKTPEEVAEFYREAFMLDITRLNVMLPTQMPKATEHVAEMIALIKRLEENGYTYRTSVGVIYDTSKFKNYAKLGRLSLEQLKAGARVEVDPERLNPSDFALWITNQPKHVMQWDSPWGKGFPGWHIECSAMSMKYLGEQFDVHCGGVDHIPVHHTNEIAQSEGATGKKWVNYWLHADFLMIDKGKMAKSGENFITLQRLIEKGYEPMDYRFFCLGSHYRTQMSFSWESLDAARNSFRHLKERMTDFLREDKSNKTAAYDKYAEEFHAMINDDLNMPEAMAVVWNVVKDGELGSKEKVELLNDFDDVLGLHLHELMVYEVPEEIAKLLADREAARKRKDFKKADEIRKKIGGLGWTIQDTDAGPVAKKA